MRSVASSQEAAAVVSSVKYGASKLWTGLQTLCGIVVVVAIVGWIDAPSARGLTVGNITSPGNRVKYNIVNDSSKAGNILTWVEQNNIRKCEHVFRMRTNTTMVVSHRVV